MTGAARRSTELELRAAAMAGHRARVAMEGVQHGGASHGGAEGGEGTLVSRTAVSPHLSGFAAHPRELLVLLREVLLGEKQEVLARQLQALEEQVGEC